MSGNEIQNILMYLAKHQDLTLEQSTRAFQIVLSGGATPAQIAAFMMGLRQKGETVTEITGGAMTMRRKMIKIKAPSNAVDTCGTGGDAKGTLNISTAAAIVVAACGVPVAKHGNRGITSASGSADVLVQLGVNMNADIALLEKSIFEANICFLMAPRFHPAMRNVTPVRVELGLRTVFNLLGPLCNPAELKNHLIGVYAKEWVRPMAETLKNLGSERAWVVHGSDGMDELTLSGPSYIAELKNGEIREFTLTPEEFGLTPAPVEAFKGLDANHNAIAMNHLLGGQRDAYRDIVLYNAAACLTMCGKASDMRQGIDLAGYAIDSGKAKTTLADLIRISNQ